MWKSGTIGTCRSSTNNLIAGEQIILLPDASGVIVNPNTVLSVGNLYCPQCKSYTFKPNGNSADNVQAIAKPTDENSTSAKDMLLYPNPVWSGQELALKAGDQPIDEGTYKLVMSNSLGVGVPVKVSALSSREIRFKPTVPTSAGVYYLFFESNGVQKTFSVILR
jgi:hypothetical protein